MKRYIFIIITVICLAASGIIIFGVTNIIRYAPATTEAVRPPADTNVVDSAVVPESTDIGSEANDQIYSVVILGDSIARGRGDQTGAGLVRAFPEQINQKELKITNAGIDGLVSSELPGIINNPEFSENLETADLFIISIGGNDLRRIAFIAVQGAEISATSADYRESRNQYLQHLQQVVRTIRNNNPTAKIMVAGLFNPFEAEELRDLIPRDAQLEVLFDWNFQTAMLIEQDFLALWVPTYDLFKWNTRKFLSFDFIHPSEEGYQLISERIMTNLLSYYE